MSLRRLAELPPVVVVASVVMLLAGCLAGGAALRPAADPIEEPPLSRLPVSSSMLVCPDPSAVGEGLSSDLTMGSPGPELGGGESGTTEAGSLDPDAPAFASVGDRGLVGGFSVDRTDAAPVVVRALGPIAAGLSAGVLTVSSAGDAQGLATSTCTEPGVEAWFVGIGTQIGHRPRLYLVNPEPAPAELDVLIFGPEGRVDVPEAVDVVVPAQSSVTFELDALAPDRSQLAVQVVVRSGRVSSALRDFQVDGVTPLGLEWVPSSGAAADYVVVPGIPGGPDERRLQLLAPGELGTRVAVRLFTAGGAIVPTGLADIELVGGQVTEVDLTGLTGGEPAAIELSADQPIVAGVRAVSGADDAQQDMGYLAAAEPLTGPALATDVRGTDGYAAELLLSAGPESVEEAEATVDYLDPETGALLASDSVTVPAGSTVVLPLTSAGDTARFVIEVRPGAVGPYAVLHLTRVTEKATYLTLVALRSPPLTVEVPRVRHDLSTGLADLRP